MLEARPQAACCRCTLPLLLPCLAYCHVCCMLGTRQLLPPAVLLRKLHYLPMLCIWPQGRRPLLPRLRRWVLHRCRNRPLLLALLVPWRRRGHLLLSLCSRPSRCSALVLGGMAGLLQRGSWPAALVRLLLLPHWTPGCRPGCWAGLDCSVRWDSAHAGCSTPRMPPKRCQRLSGAAATVCACAFLRQLPRRRVVPPLREKAADPALSGLPRHRSAAGA